MLLAIEMHYSQGNPISNMKGMSAEEQSVYRELAMEVYLMRIKRIAVEIPGEWPEFAIPVSTSVEE